MIYYADSSFLVSCYLVDSNTPRANVCLRRIRSGLPFTALHALEVRNAMELGIFRGLLPAADRAAAWACLETDLAGGRLVRTSVSWPLAFRLAVRLSESHSAVTGARSLDILHVAAAKTLRAAEFLSFDDRQRTLATAAGLTVGP